MANVVHPTVSNIYYTIIELVGKKVILTQLLEPPATTIDNTDALPDYFTGVQRGNYTAMLQYWINNGVDPNGFLMSEYIPSESWNGQSAESIDTILRMDLLYFTENSPTTDFTLDLSSPSNDPPNEGANNQYILQLIQLFANSGYVYSALINEE